MGKVIRITESELHKIIKRKIQEALEHNVDLEYSPAIGNKKRGPGKDTTDQMKKRKNIKLDEALGGFESEEISGTKVVELSDSAYAYAFKEIYGKVPNNLSEVLDEYNLPESVPVKFNMSSSVSKGDYDVPGYTDYDVNKFEVDERAIDGIEPGMVNVIKKAVEYETEGIPGDEISDSITENRLMEIISNSIKNVISRINESDEEAVSKSQHRLFGMVDAYKKGEMKKAPKKIRDIADSMSMKDVKDFAETKHKGLPNRVKKNRK